MKKRIYRRSNRNLIALLTDFGAKDYFVGAMKGVILSINAKANIVDITHEIEPQNIVSASFTLRACYRDFPKKTIFVAVVDPGVGSSRRAILVETDDYFFVAPDNGLLSFIFDRSRASIFSESEKNPRSLARKSAPRNVRVFELTEENFFRRPVSRTFHGRDVFAPVAAHLSNGVKKEAFGREIRNFARLPASAPQRINETKIEAVIIHTDRFGNLVTNLRREDLPEKFSLKINGKKIAKLQNYYAETANDEVFMIFGSAGFLEIAAFKNSAANLLKIGNKRKIDVKIL